MQHSDPLMRELIPAINEIEKYGLQSGFAIADRDKTLQKNLIKITSQQLLPKGSLRFSYQRFKALYATFGKGRDNAAKQGLIILGLCKIIWDEIRSLRTP